jgi:hypothetical protein
MDPFRDKNKIGVEGMKVRTFLFVILFSLFSLSVSAQTKTPEEKTCDLPVYSSKEVTQRARFLAKSAIQPTNEFSQNYHKFYPNGAAATLSFVYCKTGEISDIQIIKGISFDMDERLIQSVRGIKFIPAQKEGQIVSQKQIIVLRITLY